MLTSLLDMFTIILIFLIVSFEAEDYEFKLNSELTLPESTATSVFKPAVNVSVTLTGVLLREERIYALENGRATKEDYEKGQIDAIVQALEPIYLAAMEAQEEEEEDEDEVPDDDAEPVEPGDEDQPFDETIILIQADQTLDYKTLYLVMRSARVAGFSKYRLAIMKK